LITSCYDAIICEGFSYFGASNSRRSLYRNPYLHSPPRSASVTRSSTTSSTNSNSDASDYSTATASIHSPMTFRVNGQHYTITETNKKKVSLLDIVTYFNYDTGLLIVEYNKLICPRTSWDSTFISDKDQIEIITIVGGG
jgi:sulfur carrier protein